jgi:hypothetical protein
MMDLAALPWVTIVIAGTVILGAILAIAQFRSYRTTRREEAIAEEATRELHRKERDPDFKD